MDVKNDNDDDDDVIQLPKYLKCLTCSNGTPSNIILRCIPISSSALLATITLVFLSLISIPYSLHALLSLSIIIFIFFLLSATNTVSSAYLRSVILIPLNLMPSTISTMVISHNLVLPPLHPYL